MRAPRPIVLVISLVMAGCPMASSREHPADDPATRGARSAHGDDAGAEMPTEEDGATAAPTETDGTDAGEGSVDGECEASSLVCPPPACVPTGADVCDALDNDCNGLVDDGLQRFSASHVLATQSGVFWDIDVAVAPPDSAAAGGYLVTYLIDPYTDTESRNQLIGVRVRSDGSVLGEPFTISKDAANYSTVLWRGDAWSVLFTTDRTPSGHASTLSMVDIDPTSGAVAAPIVLGTGPNVLGVKVADGTPPVATWIQSASVWAAALKTKPEARSILAGGAQGRMYMTSAISVLDHGAEWAIWTDRWDLDASNNSTFPLFYVTVDADLRVRSSTQLFTPSDQHYPFDMLYLPSTHRLVGHLYQNGKTHLASHARDGTDFALAVGDLTIMARDGDGYAELGISGIQRFAADGVLAENTLHPSGGFFGDEYNHFNFSAATAGTRNRFAVAGALHGIVSLTFLGCP